MDAIFGVANPSYTIGAAVLLGWGLLDCFFGYRVFRLAVALLGALVLGLLATSAAGQWLGGGEVVSWVAFAVGAVLGLVLSFAFYLVGVFLAGFSFGYSVTLALVPFTGPAATVLIGAVAGTVCGLLALMMQRLLISAATAFGGAFRVALAAAFFFDGLDWQFYLHSPEQIPALLVGRWWVTVLTLGLGLIGLATQLRRPAAGEPKKK
ncbi:MAG TPA: DUF4203 domain-containing protein [Opitutaceae bacterium]|nr:DUF4203 domain-containing protein [Opitutaceae bacterium]